MTQKRIYELVEYQQLVSTEMGYEDPATIWMILDKSNWPEAKKFSLLQIVSAVAAGGGTYYLNNGVPYTSQQDVLDNFPIELREQFTTVNINGTEYWFLADKITLAPKVGVLSLVDKSVTLAKMADVNSGTIFYRKTAGSGVPELQTLATLKQDLGIPGTFAKQSVYNITLPASNSVAGRLAGVIAYGTGTSAFVLSAQNVIDLKITHNLGRKIASVEIHSVEDDGVRQLISFKNAYSGILANIDKNSFVIESISTRNKSLELYLTFSE